MIRNWVADKFGGGGGGSASIVDGLSLNIRDDASVTWLAQARGDLGILRVSDVRIIKLKIWFACLPAPLPLIYISIVTGTTAVRRCLIEIHSKLTIFPRFQVFLARRVDSALEYTLASAPPPWLDTFPPSEFSETEAPGHICLLIASSPDFARHSFVFEVVV